MFWEILWALILGFALSAVVQAVVSKKEMRRLLPDDSPRTLAVATGLGAASSSCSYAAVALARSLFRRGRRLHRGDRLRDRLDQPRLRARDRDRAPAGLGVRRRRVRRRAADDRPRRRRLPPVPPAAPGRRGARSRPTAASSARWRGTPRWTCRRAARARGGSACARRAASPPPPTTSSWTGRRSGATSPLGCSSPARSPPGCPSRGGSRSSWSTIRPPRRSGDPVIGPLVAVISFVCSVGNIPLAAVLWNGGISFGGVIAFIFGDLIIAPILNIYRKYYGLRMAAFLAAVLYVTMVAAGLAVELLFQAARDRPDRAERESRDGHGELELHDVPEHRLPQPRLGADLALLPARRRDPDATHDERARRRRARAPASAPSARARPTRSACARGRSRRRPPGGACSCPSRAGTGRRRSGRRGRGSAG